MAIFKLLVPEGNQRLAEPQVDHQLMRSWCASSEPSFQAQLWLLPQRWSSGNSSLDRAPSMCKDFWFQIHVRWTAAVFLLIRCPRIIYTYIYIHIYIYATWGEISVQDSGFQILWTAAVPKRIRNRWGMVRTKLTPIDPPSMICT
jgi:hypothetical protein